MKHLIHHFRQKYFCRIALMLIIVTLSTCNLVGIAQAQTDTFMGNNLINNGGFEDGTTHWRTSEDYGKVEHQIAHTGQYSFRYIIKEKKLVAQSISDVQPGKTLVFSVWIKGENLEGIGRMALEGWSSKGYLSGGYVSNKLQKTFDWVQMKGEYTVPHNADRVSLSLYMTNYTAGNVWFDDAEVYVKEKDPISSYLQSPKYRGMVKQGEKSSFKFEVDVNHQDDWKSDSIKVNTTLTNNNGKVVLNELNSISAADGKVTIEFPVPTNLALGTYILEQSIKDPNGMVAVDKKNEIQVVKEMPKVYVDAQGFTVVNKKRFFPLGLYMRYSKNEDLKRISEGGFNTVLPYHPSEDFLDLAQQNGLKAIYVNIGAPRKKEDVSKVYGIVVNRVKQYRDHPALLAWYTADEKGTDWLLELKKSYDLIRELDANHPTLQVQMMGGDLHSYADTTDIIGTDPYPVGKQDLYQTTEYTRITVDSMHGETGIWMVPQIMDHAIYKEGRKPNPPTLDEMRNQAYQAIINGARGLIWYQYYDLKFEKYPREDNINMELFHRRWKDVSSMAKEVDQIIPTILKDEKVLLNIPEKSSIQAAAWEQGDKLALLLANPYYEEKSITFALPEGWTIKDANQGEIKSTFTDGKTTFTLPSVGSGVFYLVRK